VNFFFALALTAGYFTTLLVAEGTREQQEDTTIGYEEWQCTLFKFQAKFTYAITEQY
jgi:hypothetical protein